MVLGSDIEAVSLDAICEKYKVPKPYMTKDWPDFFHLFYGKHIKALYHESAQNPKGHDIVIYTDWFPEFKKLVRLI